MGSQGLGERLVREPFQMRTAYFDLAVDELRLEADRKFARRDRLESRAPQLPKHPFERKFAIGMLSGEDEAGIAVAADFPNEGSGLVVGLLNDIRLHAGDVEPLRSQRPKPREYRCLKERREPF